MIYVSTSCIKTQSVLEDVRTLINAGFKNIELSGGAEHEENIVDQLIALKEAYGLNFLCHNYFPAPKEPFVVNLASLNDEIYDRSLSFLKNAVITAKRVGSLKFGFHAGFYFDIPVLEVGNKILRQPLFDKEKSLERFIEGSKKIKGQADDVGIYLENNVVSVENYIEFNNENPFMLTNYKDYIDINEEIDFKLLLDVGHLKVSSKTLGLDLREQLELLLPYSDYLHISDNDGIRDSNNGLEMDSEIMDILRKYDLRGKVITLEINDGISSLKESFALLRSLIEC